MKYPVPTHIGLYKVSPSRTVPFHNSFFVSNPQTLNAFFNTPISIPTSLNPYTIPPPSQKHFPTAPQTSPKAPRPTHESPSRSEANTPYSSLAPPPPPKLSLPGGRPPPRHLRPGGSRRRGGTRRVWRRSSSRGWVCVGAGGVVGRWRSSGGRGLGSRGVRGGGKGLMVVVVVMVAGMMGSRSWGRGVGGRSIGRALWIGVER